jgi:hypothetical protein
MPAWTVQEDELLEEKMKEKGTHWSLLELHFPGRKDHQLKNRYKVLLRRASKVSHAVRTPSKPSEHVTLFLEETVDANPPNFDTDSDVDFWPSGMWQIVPFVNSHIVSPHFALTRTVESKTVLRDAVILRMHVNYIRNQKASAILVRTWTLERQIRVCRAQVDRACRHPRSARFCVKDLASLIICNPDSLAVENLIQQFEANSIMRRGATR